MFDTFLNPGQVELNFMNTEYKVIANKHLQCLHLPPVLILHIQRIGYDRIINKAIKNDFQVIIKADDQIVCQEHCYKLKFIIFHLESIASGHYVGICIKDRKFVKYNESKIEEIETIPNEFYGSSNLALFEQVS